MIRVSFIFILTVILLSGCSTLPTPNQEKSADYGEYPTNYETIAKDYLMTKLREPESAEVGDITKPQKKWIGDKFTGVKYGYLVCAQVNSKELLGKMSGFRPDALLIRDGVVIDYVEGAELFSGMKLCNE